MAFALLPVLRAVHRGREDALRESLARHASPFNAHPYLAALAIGACVRLEEEGEDPSRIQRLKTAMGGSLGSLGDRLVWAAWLPVCVLAGVGLTLSGVGWAWVLPVFLLTYNAFHLSLRVWSFRTGFREGKGVGARLARLPLGRLTDRLTRLGVLLTGLVAGLAAFAGPWPGADVPWPWIVAAVGGFMVGAGHGQEAWRPALRLTVIVLVAALAIGFLRDGVT